MTRRTRPGLALGLALAALTAGADERILSFQAEIAVHADGNLIVTETIRVRSEGRQIRQGIYRDFPTDYRDRAGNRYRTGFDLLEVRRDGVSEPHHLDRQSNGWRVYIGQRGRLLETGEHEYRVRYRTSRQVGFFSGYDELYWNVTGTGWAFGIDQVQAVVRLPGAVSPADLRIAFYTGPQGAAGRQAEHRIVDARSVEFRTTAPLRPAEGLTVAVGFPKGLVTEPGLREKTAWFVGDNNAVIALGLGLLVPLVWYLWAWDSVGRDPRKGVIIPRFEPPQGLSPAGCSYVLEMALDRAAFTAAVISLGVKGWLEIVDDDGGFTLRRNDRQDAQPPSGGERAVLDALLPVAGDSITLDDEHYRKFQGARAGLLRALESEHKGRLFNLNLIYVLPALLASAAAALAAVPMHSSPALWAAYVPLTAALHTAFILLLRAPTRIGRRIMDEIEGLRMYLGTAERDRLDRMRSPAVTPEVFEAFLPYAFALGVENSWCERFANEFPEARDADGGYRSRWYRSRSGRSRSLSRIGSRLGNSLSGAIASASTPPGSSSGSGGGGSSGGGGGGGGGGGW